MNNELLRSVAALSNRDLLESLRLIVRKEDRATAEVVAHLAEIESRRLYLAQGFPSLFFYCVRALHLSEYAAYARIQAARVSRRWPVVLEKLAAGEINLTTISLLCAHLTQENHRELLEEATHRSKRQVEEIAARLRPMAEIPPSIRKLPDSPSRGGFSPFGFAGPGTPVAHGGIPGPAPTQEPGRHLPHPESSHISGETERRVPDGETLSTAAASDLNDARTPDHNIHYETVDGTDAGSVAPGMGHRDPVTPLAPGRYRIQFTAGAGTIQKLARARDLLRHQIPDGNPTIVFDRALTLLVNDLERKRFADVTRPRPRELGGSGKRLAGHPSRHISAEVRRVVWKRDGGCCAFRAPDSQRCEEKGWLEFHHRQAFAHGGPATVDNIELRCRLCRFRHKAHYADYRIMPTEIVEATSWAGLVLGNAA